MRGESGQGKRHKWPAMGVGVSVEGILKESVDERRWEMDGERGRQGEWCDTEFSMDESRETRLLVWGTGNVCVCVYSDSGVENCGHF